MVEAAGVRTRVRKRYRPRDYIFSRIPRPVNPERFRRLRSELRQETQAASPMVSPRAQTQRGGQPTVRRPFQPVGRSRAGRQPN